MCLLSAAAPRLRTGPPRAAAAAPWGAAAGAHVPLELVKPELLLIPQTQVHVLSASSALKCFLLRLEK